MAALSKKKVDIIFIDPKTMEKCCSFNECVHKFEPKTEEGDYFYFNIGARAYKDAKATNTVIKHFHECTECKRRVNGKNDRTKTYSTKKRKI